MAKRSYPLSKVYGLLEPGPVVLLTTAHRGRANVMTLSWHTMLEFEPPLVGCVVSGADFSHTALRLTKQCVINIPTAELSAQVVGCGNTSGRRLDKFQAFGLTPVPARRHKRLIDRHRIVHWQMQFPAQLTHICHPQGQHRAFRHRNPPCGAKAEPLT